MGGEESEAKLSPQPPVNNFAGADVLRWDWDRVLEAFLIIHSLVPSVSRAGRPGLRTNSRVNDFELYRRASRPGLTP